jgi:hypothetical protein
VPGAKGCHLNRAAAHPDFSKPLQPPGGMMIWIFIFMEMKHANRVWTVAMTLFLIVLFGTISFSV